MNSDRPFGVEFEYVYSRHNEITIRRNIKNELIKRNIPSLLSHTNSGQHHWCIKTDCSCDDWAKNLCGCETSTRILYFNNHGLKELADGLKAHYKILKTSEKQVDVNFITKRCGMHVHVYVGDLTINQISKLICIYLKYEKILFKQNPNNCNYCRGTYAGRIHLRRGCTIKNAIDILKESIGKKKKKTKNKFLDFVYNKMGMYLEEKYQAVSFRNYIRNGTIEFRLADGTLEIGKTIKWVKTIMTIIEQAKQTNRFTNKITKNRKSMMSGLYRIAKKSKWGLDGRPCLKF